MYIYICTYIPSRRSPQQVSVVAFPCLRPRAPRSTHSGHQPRTQTQDRSHMPKPSTLNLEPETRNPTSETKPISAPRSTQSGYEPHAQTLNPHPRR